MASQGMTMTWKTPTCSHRQLTCRQMGLGMIPEYNSFWDACQGSGTVTDQHKYKLLKFNDLT